MALPDVRAFPRVVRDPAIHGGEPIVRGTRVPVRAIVVAWRAEPDLSAMLEAYPRLTQEDVEAALAYYASHRAEMDERIRAQLADS
jgi:uncharacterized protein (DUF433 family)